MKIYILFIATICLFISCQETMEERCAREAKEYTKKNCPAKIYDNLVHDSIVFEKDTRSMCYYYTFTENVNINTKEKRDETGRIFLDNLKNSTSLKTYKDAGLNFKYTYYSSNGKKDIVFQKTFTKQDYQSAK